MTERETENTGRFVYFLFALTYIISCMKTVIIGPKRSSAPR